ncbi:MAG: undecaprenyl/decaprenyl-phosphate alpha-N-acetylglucosaminyl 1-phosphate transferase [Bacteroidetes bacterium]|nr:undecaprenyl/decaprenyl-phosphate alpha-N-acetylglucosaminyl 1-phosphate transferase [Bacteroidota bacterium]MBV6462008.1 putative undecaprenyl-phosphate N-acetylglucosaminyl 1-phosphate transferase [Flavobacteriales bacterium]WKZ76597.1 MAG: MraY family glycosyltransferase [Vicingaceae bacterium]MCL4815582.1 undecaprenyl/decaprenyl-phosphate alpha-N-acetylglucosaminyl 1-phosphate transferase [Flavobacteriales bacterium]NOG94280.1 undecaprenyl/decaprenyl-phosphate alpha-N-acetylglucosaminyl 
MSFSVLKLLLFFIGILSFGYIIYTILLKFSRNLGIRNTDETLIRWSNEQKPALGGIGFYIAFLISVASYFLLFNFGYTEINIQLRGLIIASSLAFLMGLADDAYNTKPLLKFVSQLICAFVLIYHQLYIPFFEDIWLNYLITALWVVGLMNSLNMLDNMDGITTLISISICMHFIAINIFIQSSITVFTFIIIGLLGILLSFLLFNKYPSKMFMGDTGSQFLGVSLAGLSILFFSKNPTENTSFLNNTQWLSFILSFIVPITDTTTVFINRIRKGKSPFIGGKDHTTHHLSYKGFSDNKIGLLLFSISLIANVLAFLQVLSTSGSLSLLILVDVAYIIFIFLFLYLPTLRKK